MSSTIKAFLVSVGILLLMMWLFSVAANPFEIEDSPISIGVLLIAFGLTFVWVKHEFFSDRNDK